MGAEVVHRLGVAVSLAVAVACVVWAVVVGRRERRARLRLRLIFGAERPAPRRFRWQGDLRGWLPVAGAVCAGYALVGGVVGAVLGVAAGYVAWRRWRGRGREGSADQGEEAAGQLPLAADLLTACIAAGAGPVAAAEAVGESLQGPVGDRLARAAAELRLGGEPEQAWRRLGEIPGAGPLARCLQRAGSSGAPAAEQMALLAAECRAAWARTAAARARRAAVVIAAPVGLCFLPAFLAVGIVPVVIGLAGGLLNGG
ncbi:type II secretion system F family protein [Streptomyces sp. E11-3]|uniref:type II secretion system F family protein n=1 Tax=Streptomyces sp. E11-3 TaxID=3110112 RepID=UPI00397FC54F